MTKPTNTCTAPSVSITTARTGACSQAKALIMRATAHARNDEVLERIYIGRRFKNDTERLEKLLSFIRR